MKRLTFTTQSLSRPAANPKLWLLDPKVIFLNHGSFGSSPKAVLQFQQELRNRLEREPVQFLVRDLEPLLDQAREELAEFLNGEPDNLVFVPNATSGVSTVLRSLKFKRGDEVLVTDHEYNASRNALEFAAELSGANLVVARIPFPIHSSDQIVERVLSCVTSQTKLALIDHVTSQTGLVFPIERLVRELSARGVETLVDGAHAPGMVSVNLKQLDATYYTGNCHKWICAPKTAAFLYVQPEKQAQIRPLAISHSANSPRRDRSRFLLEFSWTGTLDPSAFLSVPKALQYLGSLRPGGWKEIMQRNRALAVAARKTICEALEIPLPCPEELIGSMAAIPIPGGVKQLASKLPAYADPLQDQLRRKYKIEVPVIPWPERPKRLLRVSAQLYNSLPQYEKLAQAMKEIFCPRKSK